MNPHAIHTRGCSRRRFLAAAATLCALPGAFAETLRQTPRQTEGPFYPDKLPLDTRGIPRDILRRLTKSA